MGGARGGLDGGDDDLGGGRGELKGFTGVAWVEAGKGFEAWEVEAEKGFAFPNVWC